MKFEYEEMGNGYLATVGYKEQKTQLKTKDKIIDIMKKNKDITIKDISEILDIGRDTINEHIAKPKKENKLKRISGRKDGHWEVFRC